MEKVRLEIDALRVESFDTSDDPSQQRGTVNGYESPTDEMDRTAFETCAISCACYTGDCTDPCPPDAGDYNMWLKYAATFIGSGT